MLFSTFFNDRSVYVVCFCSSNDFCEEKTRKYNVDIVVIKTLKGGSSRSY